MQQSSHSDDAPRKVVHNLRVLARKHKDAALVQIASRMSVTVSEGSKTGEDIFAELKQQMMNAIKRLEDEDAADYTHKTLCDKNLAETNAKVDDQKAEIEKHTAKIGKHTSNSARVKVWKVFSRFS